MAKAVPEILDEEELEGMPDSVIVTVPLTEELATRMIEPCVRWMAQNSDSMVDIDEGRLRVGITFDPGRSQIMFDMEEVATECLEGEDLPLAIVALERMMETLQAMLPEAAEERAALRPDNYDELAVEDKEAIDRALGLDIEESKD